MRLTIACIILPLLGGCSAEAPRLDRLASRDVPCLHRQVDNLDVSFRNAVAVCGVPKPDLTGSGQLQQDALDAKVAFTIRPRADVYLKQAQAETITGGLIPQTNAGAAFTTAFRWTMPLSDGH